jgi:IclR family transcriptional regulator, acetate operon repressor
MGDGARPPGDRVRSVTRAVRLLDAITERGSARLGELADATQLTPSTALRLLTTLADEGYVGRDGSGGRYRLGYRLLALPQAVEQSMGALLAAARPHMVHLRDTFDETTNLLVFDEGMVTFLDQVESSRPVRMFSRIGNRVPAHASAAGKAMLAQLSTAELEAYLAQRRLDRLTPQTITDPEELRAELATIRSNGYAVDDREFDDGLMCVAAAITGARPTAAAISLSGPAERVRRLDISECGPVVATAVRAVALDAGPTVQSG